MFCAKVLQNSAVSLVLSTSEYCVPIWFHNIGLNTTKIGIALNSTMRIVSGCLNMTSVDYLSVIAGIVPPDI